MRIFSFRYVLGFENLLRLVDCRITVPFWNWALYSNMIWSINPTYHMWKNIGGFGGNGDSSKAYCVTTGYFKYLNWVTLEYENKVDILLDTCDGKYNKTFCIRTGKTQYKGCLRRSFGKHTPSYKSLFTTINDLTVNQFNIFENRVRVHWHDAVHNCIGQYIHICLSTVYKAAKIIIAVSLIPVLYFF